MENISSHIIIKKNTINLKPKINRINCQIFNKGDVILMLERTTCSLIYD